MRRIDKLCGWTYGVDAHETIVAGAVLTYFKCIPEAEARDKLKSMMLESVAILAKAGSVTVQCKVDSKVFAETVDKAVAFCLDIARKRNGDVYGQVMDMTLIELHGNEYLKSVPDELVRLVGDLWDCVKSEA